MTPSGGDLAAALTPERIKVRLRVAYIYLTFRKKTRGHLLLYRCFISTLQPTHTHRTPLSQNLQGILSPALHSDLLLLPSPFSHTTGAFIYILALGRVLKVKVENPRPGWSRLRGHILTWPTFRGHKHGGICAHACSHAGARCSIMKTTHRLITLRSGRQIAMQRNQHQSCYKRGVKCHFLVMKLS